MLLGGVLLCGYAMRHARSVGASFQRITCRAHHSFGFLFDIDGVFMRGHSPIPAAFDAIKSLQTPAGKWRVPVIFVTNAGMSPPSYKASLLSQLFNCQVDSQQVVMSYSPYKLLSTFHDMKLCVCGQGPVKELASNLGFNNLITVQELSYMYPSLDAMDMQKRLPSNVGSHGHTEPVDGILLLNEPVGWETALQLTIDLLLTGGQPYDPAPYLKVGSRPHIPVLACNADLLWKCDAPHPRFGHGSFLISLECLYQQLTGQRLHYTAMVGKPSLLTFQYATHCLNLVAEQLTTVKTPIERVYCIGDNVDTDIYGANLYDVYLQNKIAFYTSSSVHPSPFNGILGGREKLFSSMSKEMWNVDTGISPLKCESILVLTGVSSHPDLSKQTADLDKPQKDLYTPKYVAHDVNNAVEYAFTQEGYSL